ncbi:hypothetical protein N9L18_00150 [Candidatus Pacebacteria bacterium]|nr:hypothetical protein [Candidatus Paceibacterota bacterium]
MLISGCLEIENSKTAAVVETEEAPVSLLEEKEEVATPQDQEATPEPAVEEEPVVGALEVNNFYLPNNQGAWKAPGYMFWIRTKDRSLPLYQFVNVYEEIPMSNNVEVYDYLYMDRRDLGTFKVSLLECTVGTPTEIVVCAKYGGELELILRHGEYCDEKYQEIVVDGPEQMPKTKEEQLALIRPRLALFDWRRINLPKNKRAFQLTLK